MQVAIAQINPIVGDLPFNKAKILAAIEKAKSLKAEIVLFPELALTGYPPEDLLLLPGFIEEVQKTLFEIVDLTHGITAIIGTVRENPSYSEKGLFNTAAIIENGTLVGFQDKSLLPDYDVFSERRYFEPAAQTDLWSIRGKRIAITICEDLWQHADAVGYSRYLRDPVLELKSKAPELLLNLSASPFFQRRHLDRFEVLSKAAKTLGCPVILCNQIGGNDSLIFDGYSLAVDAKGRITTLATGFQEEILLVDTEKKGRSSPPTSNPIEELYSALVLGVRDYFSKLGFKKAALGLSGGIDSAVVACIAKEALGKENVLALALPSQFSSPLSFKDALGLVKNLGISLKSLSIEKPFECFLELLKPEFKDLPFDTTEENLQARIRGMILMAFSNKFGYLVLSTGNKSEMAMGYFTLYGDACGGLSVLADVTKRQVYLLADYINRKKEVIPKSIIKKPPTAELRPSQRDTDSLPEYSIVDTVLEEYVEEHSSPEEIAEKHGLDLSLVKELVRRIHLNEYKRRQSPPGLRVTKKAFTVGRRFPIVQHWNI